MNLKANFANWGGTGSLRGHLQFIVKREAPISIAKPNKSGKKQVSISMIFIGIASKVHYIVSNQKGIWWFR